MQKIAITGKIASGKSTVARQLQLMNLPVLEADEVVAQLYQTKEIKDLLQERWQLEFFLPDGEVDKRKLAHFIFTHEAERQWWQGVLWPRVKTEVELWIFQQQCLKKERVWVVVPLLFEAGWENDFAQIWLVTADREEILSRLQARDRWPLMQARTVYELQWSDEIKLTTKTIIINNRGTIARLQETVKLLVKQKGK